MSRNLKRPQAIFFDWDGTLADSYSFLENAHNYVLRTLGRTEFQDNEFETYFGQPRQKIYGELYGEEEAQAQKHFEAFVTKHHRTLLKPVPQAGEFLSLLKTLDLMAGIVTNKHPDFVTREIEGFGWTSHFASIVGAGEAAQDKPSAGPLLLALERANFQGDSTDIWYVGDTITDYQCAQNAAAPFVYLAHEHLSHNWLEGLPPPLMVVKNFTELKRRLEESTVLQY